METTTPDGTGDLWSLLSKRAARSRTRDGLKAKTDLWKSLGAIVDPARFRPALAPDVEIKEFKLKWGNDYAVIANPRDMLYYRLEPVEVEIVRLMDGSRTVEEIVVERFQESGDLAFAQVTALVRLLEEGNFLEGHFVDVAATVERVLHPPNSLRQRLARLAKDPSIEWKGSDGLVRWFYRRGLKLMFARRAQLMNIAVSVLGFAAFVALVRSGRFSIGEHSAATEGLVLMALGYFLTFVHELGHALVLIHNGRRVKSAGFMIYFGSPAFFVDATDGLMVDRPKRIMQALAGPYAELIVAGAASLFVWAFPTLPPSSTLYKFVVLNYFVLFMNLVPFLELDGYFIFSDLIQVPDLRARSLEFVRHDLLRKIYKRERFSVQEVGLAVYSILGLAFTVLALIAAFFFWRGFFGDLVQKLWHRGLVGRLILALLAIFIAGPLLRGGTALLRAMGRRIRYLYEDLRFRLQSRWRVEAAQLIDAIPMFDDLPEEVLDDLAGRVRRRTLSAGGSVVRQGDIADAFYVVGKGDLNVVQEDPSTGDEQIVWVLKRGDAFGELGLVRSAPRAATVRASVHSQVFEIDKGTFERLLANMIHIPEFAPSLQAMFELKEIPAFSHLELDQLADLLKFGEWVNIGPNQEIFKQGEAGDAFYAMRSGKAEVVRDRKVVQTLGAGDHFGELALLRKAPRAATVRTVTPVRAYRVGPRGFNRLVRKAFKRGALATPELNRTWQH